VYSFVLQTETQNNQLKAAIPAHSAPELGDDASASWSNNIGRPMIEFEFSVLRADEFQCIYKVLVFSGLWRYAEAAYIWKTRVKTKVRSNRCKQG